MSLFLFPIRQSCMLVAVLLLTSTAALAQQVPTWEWLTPFRGNQVVSARRIAIDGVGNSYVTGEFTGQATFGTTTLISRGWNDTFVAKYDARGACLWVRQAGATIPNPVQFGPTTNSWGIAVDNQGNAYVTGTCKVRTTFDNVEISPFNGRNETMFLAKYSAQGSILWAKAYDMGWPGGVATDTDGTVYVSHAGSAGPNPSATLVSKMDGQGNILWSRGARGSGSGGGASQQVKVGPNHEIYLHGNYRYGTAMDVSDQRSTPLSNAGLVTTGIGNSAVFLARYTATGTLDWVRTGSSPGVFTYNSGLAVDGAGNAFITGYTISGGLIFGDLVLAARGEWDSYVVKYDAQGQILWGHQEGSASVDNGMDIAVDGGGNAYLLGYFYKGRAAFGNVVLDGGSQYSNLALVKYNPLGRGLWGVTQQSGDFTPWALAANRNGDIYLVGEVRNTTQLGSLSMTISGGSSSSRVESLIAKLKSNQPLVGPGGAVDPVAEGLMPNIITPNGDGYNDQFKIPALAAEAWSCAVYNRWGVKVFEAPAYRQDWQAEGLGDGLYYYVLKNRVGQMKKGWVEVRH